MQQTYFVVRTLVALGSATLFAACSGSGPSGTITPSGVGPDSQTRLAQTMIDSHGVRGGFAYVSNAGSNNISAYTINAISGALTPVAGSPFTAGTEPTRRSSLPPQRARARARTLYTPQLYTPQLKALKESQYS